MMLGAARRWRWRLPAWNLGSRSLWIGDMDFLSPDKHAPIPDDILRILEKRMSSIEDRHACLSKALLEPGIASEKLIKMNKELRNLDYSVDMIKALRAKEKEVIGLKELVKESVEDEEMRRLASGELQTATREVRDAQHDVLLELIPKDEADSRGYILEELEVTKRQFLRLISSRCRHVFLVHVECLLDFYECSQEASAVISGDGVYGALKFESGVHRVQRVPVTEKAGRIHTSTASVAILPEANEVDVEIRNDEIKIDTYRAGGAGGQHVNTTCSAVRVTHAPTGIVVAIQDERSQHKNKAKALSILYARLYELERSRAVASRSELRQDQIGSSDRSERIRTYNFPQGRVTDHRVGVTQHAIEQIMEGIDVDNWKHLFERQRRMVHEMTAADGTLRVVSFPWCIKFRSVCKNLLKRMKLIGRRSSIRGVLVKSSSNKHRISWRASFAYRQQQKQKLKKSGSSLWSFSGYSKLKNSCTEALDRQEVIHRNLEDSQASSSSFSFKNDAEDLGHGKGKKILSPHPGVQRSEAMKLKSRWDEVVEMVVADSFDDLVDLEEFLGYYMLLNCPVFRAMVQRFFSEFCVEFCEDEELLAVSLFIPEMQDFPSFGNSSERELECLPPSPC
ncbi:hypothetical protein SELMODRAFT_405091 [Selaginella moellendorffii]|uniref:Prokaryotic-type class I peptide chain release factors domain-containing protein n=1 Tax=Selaginella moellendorffii TaxID=88036 RepID=D8QYC8_SELML|nr:hypothetical protein SELMODRAFT_405091 [Selaginella moellendorffii]